MLRKGIFDKREAMRSCSSHSKVTVLISANAVTIFYNCLQLKLSKSSKVLVKSSSSADQRSRYVFQKNTV